MHVMTIKLPPALEAQLAQAAERANLSKSELVRRALAVYLAPKQGKQAAASALDLVGDLVGCFEGGPADLSSNPRYMDDFGK